MKLANGSGSIVCLDKSGKKRRKPWAVRITVGWKNGKQDRKYLGYYATQTEAIMALAEYHKNGYDIDLSKLTLYEVFDKWYERVEQKNLSASAMGIHKMTRTKLGELGKKQFKTIKSNQLQTWFDGVDLKPRSKTKVKSTMKQLYDYAIKHEIVHNNYASGLEINEKAEKTGEVLTSKEIELLWKHQDNDIAQQLLILVYTGMRVGEMLDLHRDNIHLEKGYMVGGNKTENGKNRIIPIHNKIRPFIEQQLGDGKWLIESPRGNQPKSYTTVRSECLELFKQLGMSHKIHDCRKTAVSIMHTGGIPMESIRLIVGHSGKGVTETVYLYKTAEELVEIINTLEIPF